MKKFSVLFLLFVIFFCTAASVDLIKNGKSNMAIVLEDVNNPLLKMAGREFADMLKKRTGATVQVMIREKLHDAEIVKMPFIQKRNKVKKEK